MRQIDDDFKIIKRVLNGDIQAFNALVQKYQFRINNVVLPYANDHTEAMDITQETFLRAYRSLDKFRFNSAFYTWLYRIAVNAARSHVTREKKHRYHHDITFEKFYSETRDPELKQVYDIDNPESLMVSDDTLGSIFITLKDMPTEMRTAFLLREVEGLSYQEVAKIMKCPLGTVRSRIYRARGFMQLTLESLTSKN